MFVDLELTLEQTDQIVAEAIRHDFKNHVTVMAQEIYDFNEDFLENGFASIDEMKALAEEISLTYNNLVVMEYVFNMYNDDPELELPALDILDNAVQELVTFITQAVYVESQEELVKILSEPVDVEAGSAEDDGVDFWAQFLN